jgi:hypothetical protein
MAIVFELVLNYGQNHAAIEDARRVVAAHPPLPAGPHRVALHEPLVDTVLDAADRPFLEMSIIPVGVGHNVAIDRHSRVRLTPEELDELGAGLYGLLADGFLWFPFRDALPSF